MSQAFGKAEMQLFIHFFFKGSNWRKYLRNILQMQNSSKQNQRKKFWKWLKNESKKIVQNSNSFSMKRMQLDAALTAGREV
jgi:hypothetical protein